MCGRFALYTEPAKVARFLQATNQADETWQPSFNIPPTERIVGARKRVDDNGDVVPPDPGHGVLADALVFAQGARRPLRWVLRHELLVNGDLISTRCTQ